jgi:hypothetical protein
MYVYDSVFAGSILRYALLESVANQGVVLVNTGEEASLNQTADTRKIIITTSEHFWILSFKI